MKINLIVKPNSSKGPLIEFVSDGSLIVYIREIASDNQANDALIKLLAKHFKISKSHINIIRGKTSKHKLIEIDI